MEKNTGNAVKRKKEKFNDESPPIIDKRKPLKHDWQQTDSEVTITLFVGSHVKIGDVKVECTDQTCTVKLPDGRVFSCQLYRAVVPEGTDLKQKSNKIFVKMVKKAPQNWITLMAVEDEEPDCNENESSDKPVVELSHIKHDFYEKIPQTLTLNVFVRQISKDAFSADFQEDHFVLRFHTSDQSFLKLNDATEDTTFMWKVNVKEEIVPKECSFRVNEMKVEVSLKKKVAQKWNSMEKLPVPVVPVVPSRDWIPVAKSPSPCRSEKSISEDTDILNLPSVIPLDNKSSSPSPNSSPSPPKTVSKKPTCLVSPLSRDSEHVKGLTGLDNLGNTCFMNSVLQCLANTREFKDYFLESHFQQELNTENPLGTGGNLAVAFATLLRMLWTGNQTSMAPVKMKSLIGQKAVQFAGFAQHDAQELMAFLLDGLHEDLNRVKKKPYVENVDYDGLADEVAAEESWKQYTRRNDSVVVDLFQGQYKSRLQCPVCQKVSITFDPFLYLSLPLPKKQWMISLYFFSLVPSQKPLKLAVRLSQDATTDELKEKISSRVSVKPRNLRIYEIYKHKFLRRFRRGFPLNNVKSSDTIVVYEVMDEELSREPVLELLIFQRTQIPKETNKCSFCKKSYDLGSSNKLRRCTKCYLDAYCDQNCQKEHWSVHKSKCVLLPELVGCPFIISLPASRATYSTIVRHLEAYSRYSVDVFQPPISPPKNFGSLESQCSLEDSEPVPKELQIDSPSVPNNKSCPTEQENNEEKPPPLITTEENSEVKIQEKVVDRGSGDEVPTCMVIAQPSDKTRPLFQLFLVDDQGHNLPAPNNECIKDMGDVPLEVEPSCFLAMDWQNLKRLPNYALVQSKELDFEWLDPKDKDSDLEIGDATLDNCLQIFTEPEVLSPQEAWYCPDCKTHREATKEMSLWRLPPVLIVQLKRFSFNNLIWRDKINRLVLFPVRGLDLFPYVQKPLLPGEARPVYDLYAVVNHTGNILGGHYTSCARLPDITDTRRNALDWRLFDDSYVNYIPESEIVSKAAYVLFYRRRCTEVNLIPPLLLPSSNKESKDRENSKMLVQEVTDSNLLESSPENPNGVFTVGSEMGSLD